MLIQCLCQGQCFLGGCQEFQSMRNRLFYTSEVYQHGHILLPMSLRLSQVQVLLKATPPFQNVQPGLGESICINGRFTLPGSPGNIALQHALEWWIVPAVESCRLWCIKRFIYTVVLKLLLPGR